MNKYGDMAQGAKEEGRVRMNVRIAKHSNHYESDDEDKTEPKMNWPTAFATAFHWLAVFGMVVIFAQCESGRIW